MCMYSACAELIKIGTALADNASMCMQFILYNVAASGRKECTSNVCQKQHGATEQKLIMEGKPYQQVRPIERHQFALSLCPQCLLGRPVAAGFQVLAPGRLLLPEKGTVGLTLPAGSMQHHLPHSSP